MNLGNPSPLSNTYDKFMAAFREEITIYKREGWEEAIKTIMLELYHMDSTEEIDMAGKQFHCIWIPKEEWDELYEDYIEPQLRKESNETIRD